MADTKKTFPMLPVAAWWKLRKKFKQSIPGVVSINYLSSVLNIGEASARANIYPFLKSLGIIEDEGKPTARAKLWRDDGHYPEVCKAILKESYPSDLIDAVDNPRENRDAAKRWFANHTGAGDTATGRMAALYTVLVEADPNGGAEATKASSSSAKDIKTPKTLRTPKKDRGVATSNVQAKEPMPEQLPSHINDAQAGRNIGPDVNLNLQIHISADASADQIEQIFASMAKHIYRRG